MTFSVADTVITQINKTALIIDAWMIVSVGHGGY